MGARRIGAGWISTVRPRRERLRRWNWKRTAALAIAATLAAQASPSLGLGDDPTIQQAPRISRVISTVSTATDMTPAAASILAARNLVADCQKRFERVDDYSCVFTKRELVKGRMTPTYQIGMKVRTSPFSVYMKFHNPKTGREAIYVNGRNNGKVVAHDVGVAKILTGTLRLDPRERLAMEDNRHPITEAGIGNLIDTLVDRWSTELQPDESRVTVDSNVSWAGRPCTLITSTHTEKRAEFLFHEVKVYVDHELGLPVRFEAYDWPREASGHPILVEEYSYHDVRINVGLGDLDFHPENKAYSYGRF